MGLPGAVIATRPPFVRVVCVCVCVLEYIYEICMLQDNEMVRMKDGDGRRRICR